MTSIAVIKQVMRFYKVKVNNICIYELERIISRADSIAFCIYEIESNISRANTRTRNCSRTSSRKETNTYEAAAAEALDLGSMSSPAMSSRRSWTSGKKSSSGK